MANHRDNLLSCMRRTGYEFAAVSFVNGFCPDQMEKLCAAVGRKIEPDDYFGASNRAVDGVAPVAATDDFRRFYREELPPDTKFNPYGVGHSKGSADARHMRRIHHPMKDFDSLEQIKSYPWPEFPADSFRHVPGDVARVRSEGFAVSAHMAQTIWEVSWAIRSMEALMMDMAMGDEKAVFILDKLTANACLRAEKYAAADVDILHLGDDIGMQSRMMMAPEFWREWLKGRLARVIQAARRVKPEILIFYHSCGYVEPVIGDLVEVGVDILNPVQPECMDFQKIHAEYGDRLSFWGTLGTQSTLPFGSPDDVRAVVKRNLDIAGARGGLVVGPTHMVEPEVPWENVVAYVDAVKTYRIKAAV